MSADDRLLGAGARGEDEALDRSIRPRRLADYIGQPAVKRQLGVFIQAVSLSVAPMRMIS